MAGSSCRAVLLCDDHQWLHRIRALVLVSSFARCCDFHQTKQDMNAVPSKEFRRALESEASDYGLQLTPQTLDRLVSYYELLNSWNARLHLVAPTSPKEFATRHILESLLLLGHLPQDARVVDVGSGAGLPMIPCLIARPDIRATLIESSKKKSVFLREALHLSQTHTRATVTAERFEDIGAPDIDYVTCRALERFEQMIPKLIAWAPTKATLLLFGGPGLGKLIEALNRGFAAQLLPHSEKRFLYVLEKQQSLSTPMEPES